MPPLVHAGRTALFDHPVHIEESIRSHNGTYAEHWMCTDNPVYADHPARS